MTMKLHALPTAVFLIIFGLVIGGCATEWKNGGTFCKTVQTKLVVDSSPSGRAYVNGDFIGNTPTTKLLEYCAEIKKETRSVSYWNTQPGASTLLSIASLGIYVPFSLIPADADTHLAPTGSYMNNRCIIKVEREGFPDWVHEYIGRGEDEVALNAE
jgi:hypothetical protein